MYLAGTLNTPVNKKYTNEIVTLLFVLEVVGASVIHSPFSFFFGGGGWGVESLGFPLLLPIGNGN